MSSKTRRRLKAAQRKLAVTNDLKHQIASIQSALERCRAELEEARAECSRLAEERDLMHGMARAVEVERDELRAMNPGGLQLANRRQQARIQKLERRLASKETQPTRNEQGAAILPRVG